MTTMAGEAISLKGAIFLTISPFLVIGDNTTKASNTCRYWKNLDTWVEKKKILAFLDDYSMSNAYLENVLSWS